MIVSNGELAQGTCKEIPFKLTSGGRKKRKAETRFTEAIATKKNTVFIPNMVDILDMTGKNLGTTNEVKDS